MFSKGFHEIAVLLLTFSASNALTDPTGGAPGDTPAPLANLTLPQSMGPGARLEDLRIDCRGAQYGRGLRYASCLDAFRTFRHGQAVNPAVIRRRGPEPAAHKLPWIWASGDGRCTFNIVMRGRGDSETTTGTEIARAAWQLMNACVRDQGGQGGVISGIGQHGALGIIIRPYDPVNVECGNRPRTYDSSKCEALLGEVPADTGPELVWGPPHTSGVDNPIPHTWVVAPYNECRMIVVGTSERATDRMTLYDAWYAAAILVAMCVRIDRGGLFRNLGAQRKIHVIIDDGSDPLQLANEGTLSTKVAGTRTIMTGDGEWDAGWNSSLSVS